MLPPLAPGPHAVLRHCVAIASTLVAGVELARDSVLQLEQEVTWGPILVTRQPLDTGVVGSSA